LDSWCRKKSGVELRTEAIQIGLLETGVCLYQDESRKRIFNICLVSAIHEEKLPLLHPQRIRQQV